MALTFGDVDISFSEDELKKLGDRQKKLYEFMMSENEESPVSLVTELRNKHEERRHEKLNGNHNTVVKRKRKHFQNSDEGETRKGDVTFPETQTKPVGEFKREVIKLKKGTKPRKRWKKAEAYICGECGKSFSWNSVLLTHQKTHTRNKYYPCHKCGKQFSRSSCLANHQQTHRKVNLNMCQQCDKSFSSKGNLNRHLATHRKRKRYTCPECGESFIRSATFYRHRKTHSEANANPCEKCGKRFSQSDLITHLLLHTRETKPESREELNNPPSSQV